MKNGRFAEGQITVCKEPDPKRRAIVSISFIPHRG